MNDAAMNGTGPAHRDDDAPVADEAETAALDDVDSAPGGQDAAVLDDVLPDGEAETAALDDVLPDGEHALPRGTSEDGAAARDDVRREAGSVQDETARSSASLAPAPHDARGGAAAVSAATGGIARAAAPVGPVVGGAPVTAVDADGRRPVVSVRPDPQEASDETDAERPRTRWAAIIWGTVLAIAAGAGLWAATSRERLAGIREAVIDALLGLNPVTSTVVVLLVVGALILLIGLTGLARGLQRRHAARS